MDLELDAIVTFARAVGAAELANVGVLLVAVAGIFLTLGQMILLRRQLRLDALIKITDSNREIVALGFERPSLWAILEGRVEREINEEVLIHRHYLQLWVNHMQLMWGAWKLGVVSECEWEAYRLDMAELLRTPASREHWGRVSAFYPEGFRRLVNGLQ